MLRSREFQRFLFLMVLLGAAAAAAGFLMSFGAGVISAAASILFIALACAFTGRRYRQLSALSAYLRKVNGGDYALDMRDNAEGELSILKSEIYKVTVMLREQNEALKEDKKALADALFDISHQLKTPLTSMFVMTDLLFDELLPADRRREFTSRIRAQLERLQWLLTSLLKMARLDAKAVRFDTRLVSATSLIEKACAPLLIPAELKNQTIALRGNGVFLRCDENWTAEALLNILKNCVEHTPENGTISLTCAQNPLFSEIVIRDSGPGINPSDLPHIFERFYRGKNAPDDSTGIGLAMAASVVQKQGGSISAALSDGSVFTIRFPK